MRVKKQIALLLSGAILAGSLAGCAQTAVDHHFFTDTIYTTEIVENITRETTLQDIIDRFDLKLVVWTDTLNSPLSGNSDPLREEGVCESISGDDIDKFLNCKNFFREFALSAYEK